MTEERKPGIRVGIALALGPEDLIALMAERDCYRSMTNALMGDVRAAEHLRRLARIGIMTPPVDDDGWEVWRMIMRILERLGLAPIEEDVVKREMEEGLANLRARLTRPTSGTDGNPLN